ncbi:MAG: PfkB family carbohydrate kinase [Planctomycetota bacterium]
MVSHKKFDVVGVGCCAVDYLGILPRFPRMDEKLWMEEFTKQGGGMVGTALVAIARLGAKPCYVGRVGSDEFGRFVIESFDREGVDTSEIELVEGKSARVAFVFVDRQTGARTILIPTQNIPPVEAQHIRPDAIRAGKILLIDPLEPGAARAAEIAKEAGMPVVIDAEYHGDDPGRILDNCNYIIASEGFAQHYTGVDDPIKAARRMFEEQSKLSQHKVVVVTRGDRGSYTISADESFEIPAFKMDSIVDTTGCGDVFHGAYVYGVLQEWGLKRIAEFSSAVAAMKTRKLGGRAGIPTLAEVADFLRNRGKYQI